MVPGLQVSEIGGHDSVGIWKRKTKISGVESSSSEFRLSEVDAVVIIFALVVVVVFVGFESFETVGRRPNDACEARVVRLLFLHLLLDDRLPDSSRQKKTLGYSIIFLPYLALSLYLPINSVASISFLTI